MVDVAGAEEQRGRVRADDGVGTEAAHDLHQAAPQLEVVLRLAVGPSQQGERRPARARVAASATSAARSAASSSGSTSGDDEPLSPRLTTSTCASAPRSTQLGEAPAARHLGVVRVGVHGQHGPRHPGVGPHGREGSGRTTPGCRVLHLVSSPAMTTDPRELADLAGGWPTDVGREIARRRSNGIVRVATKSTATDMVTEFDRRGRGSDRRRAGSRAPGRRLPGRGGGGPARILGCAMADRPHRRHDELPLRPAGLGRLHRRLQ